MEGHGEEQTQELCLGYERHEHRQMTMAMAGGARTKQERIDEDKAKRAKELGVLDVARKKKWSEYKQRFIDSDSDSRLEPKLPPSTPIPTTQPCARP